MRTVQIDGFAEYGWLAAETALPESVGQQNDASGAWPVLFRCEIAPRHGLDTQCVKKRGFHLSATEAHGKIRNGEIALDDTGPGSECLKRLLRPLPLVIGSREQEFL